jgi:MGS-like domain
LIAIPYHRLHGIFEEAVAKQSIDHCISLPSKCNKDTEMQTHCLPNLADTATFDRTGLIGSNEDSRVRNPEKPSPHPLTRLIPSRKRIALVAHDNRKEQLASWTLKHRTRLIEHELYATSHTADIIAKALNAPVFRLLSGPLGGDQQIGSRIAESKIDVLIFFWDPLGHQPHDSDVKGTPPTGNSL